MKAFYFTCLVLFTGTLYSSAQDSATMRPRKYNLIITDTGNLVKIGYPGNINDSTLYLSAIWTKKPIQDLSQLAALHYTSIKSVQLHEQGGFGRSILTGTIAGALIGAIAAVVLIPGPGSSGDKFDFGIPAGARLAGGGLTGLTVGCLIGVIRGAALTKKFTINGNRQKFRAMQSAILTKVYGE